MGPERNGKVMQYVGWADQIISPGGSLHYYETVHAFMTSNSELDIDNFYRLYTVPGMNHWSVLCVSWRYVLLMLSVQRGELSGPCSMGSQCTDLV